MQRWMRPESYERLIPPDARSPERDLFLSDFEIVVDLVESDLKRQSAGEQFGASHRPNRTLDSLSPVSVPVLHLTGEGGLKTLIYRVLTKEHFAGLYERGKVKAERYFEEVNKLRKDEALPPQPSIDAER